MKGTIFKANTRRGVRSNICIKTSIFAKWIPIKEASHSKFDVTLTFDCDHANLTLVRLEISFEFFLFIF